MRGLRVEDEHAPEAGEEGIIELTEEARKLAGLRVETLGRRELDEWLTAPGVLHANEDETATVSPAVAGTVEAVLVKPGDAVTRGQAVAVLRCPELATAQAEAATAAAELKAAEEALARREALAAEGEFAAAPLDEARRANEETRENLRLAEATLTRVRRLAQLGASDRPALEEAQAGLSEAREAVGAAETRLASARAAQATSERIAGRLGASTGRVAADARVGQAEAALAAARANRERLEAVLPDGLATAQEVEAARAEEAEARADLEDARQALHTVETPTDEARLTAGTADQDVRAAEAELTEARARLEVAEARHARESAVAGEALPSAQGTAEAETAVAVARAAHEQARLAWDREQRLHKGDLRSREALADAESVVTSARARKRAAERIVAVLGQGRQRGDGRVTLVAPVSGRISARTARVGAMAEAGTSLLEIIGARSIWVEAAFYQKDLPRLAAGQPMRVEVTAFPGRALETTVYAVDPALDEHTRKAKVRGLLDNPGDRLRPDMLATVSIRVGVLAEALAAPAEAVQGDGDCEFVFVEEEPGRYRRVEVATGQRSGGYIELLSGIDPGARIVTEGAFLLKSEGSEIEDSCGD